MLLLPVVVCQVITHEITVFVFFWAIGFSITVIDNTSVLVWSEVNITGQRTKIVDDIIDTEIVTMDCLANIQIVLWVL